MKKRYRLNQESDFQRVRKFGQKYAHPFFILVAVKSELNSSRLGVICSRNVGNAVQRNLVKRRIKEIFQEIFRDQSLSYDLIVIARSTIMNHRYADLRSAIIEKLRQAKLL